MHNVKAKNIQVDNLESRDEVSIASQNLLRYAEALIPDNDNDLVPKWYVDTQTIQFTYFDQTSPYYSSGSGGIISIPDFDTDYPTLSANQIVRMQGHAIVDGVDIEFDSMPVVTRDGSGNITAATFNFGFDTAPTSFKVRMY